jgi:hypothetical protein
MAVEISKYYPVPFTPSVPATSAERNNHLLKYHLRFSLSQLLRDQIALNLLQIYW